MVTRRLKELLEAQKTPSYDVGSAGGCRFVPSSERVLQHLQQGLVVDVHMHEAYFHVEDNTPVVIKYLVVLLLNVTEYWHPIVG